MREENQSKARYGRSDSREPHHALLNLQLHVSRQARQRRPVGDVVRLETALELAERTSSGWVEGLGKLLREERLMLWVGSCGVLGGEGRSK